MANLQELIPAIFTGPNGERLTPEQIAQRQEIAQSLMARATDTRPDAGGIASVLTKGLLGFQSGRNNNSADNAIKANATASEANMSAMLGSLGLGGGNAFPAAVAAGASPTSAVATETMPVQANPLAEGSEWLKYANQGAIRNQPINEKLTGALSFLPEMGVTMKVVSGGETADRKASNSGRHMHGNAADVDFYVGDRKLTPKNDQDRAMLSQIVQRGKAAGITGWGEGDDYMGSGRVHLGFGNAGVWGAKGKGANAPEWLVNAYNSTYQPTNAANAIESISPLEQGDSNPSLPMGQLPQTEGAYIDPTVAVVQGGQITPTAFDARFSGSPEQVAPMQQPAQSPQVPQQAAIDPRLAQLNDMALGGALSESGGSPVAQALAGYFPDAPSANRAPIMAQQQPAQMPMQQASPQSAQQIQMGGINPAVIQALSSPYATAQEKQIAGLLLNKQMEQQSTAQAQQQEMQRRQQVAQAAGINPIYANDPELWKQAAQDAFNKKNQTLVNAGDGRLYDPNSGQWIVAPNNGQQGFRMATPEEANKYGSPYGQFGPDGRFYPVNPPSGMSFQVDPATGQVSFQQGSGVKPLTEGQSKDAVYATRAEGSLPTIDQYGDALTDPVERAKEYDPTGIARGTQSKEFQMAKQAGDEFLQAILRKDTGAAITKDEMDSYGSVYLPKPGDSPELLSQKRVARSRALAALQSGMPPQAILNVEKALGKSNNDSSNKEKIDPLSINKPISEWTMEELQAVANGN